jgi:malate/lactate dehydrogenase
MASQEETYLETISAFSESISVHHIISACHVESEKNTKVIPSIQKFGNLIIGRPIGVTNLSAAMTLVNVLVQIFYCFDGVADLNVNVDIIFSREPYIVWDNPRIVDCLAVLINVARSLSTVIKWICILLGNVGVL